MLLVFLLAAFGFHLANAAMLPQLGEMLSRGNPKTAAPFMSACIKDRTEGTGRFNLAAGALATAVGIGAALSNTIGGVLIQHVSYQASFLGLAAIAAGAFGLLWLAVPETLPELTA